MREQCPLWASAWQIVQDKTALGLDLLDLRNEEVGSLLGVGAVRQVRCQDGGAQVSVADSVARVGSTDDLDLVLGEVRNLAVVGAELGVSEGHHSSDLGLLRIGGVLDGAVVDGRTLAVFEAVSISSRPRK